MAQLVNPDGTVEKLPEPKPPAPNLLRDAEQITSDDRQRFYGHPADNHGNTAALWSAYLRRRYGIADLELTARDVCLMMVLLKVSRDANRVNRDNLVDIAGYARNAEMIEEREGGK